MNKQIQVTTHNQYTNTPITNTPITNTPITKSDLLWAEESESLMKVE
jgi:hypothetical protein